jgi:geranylgeranyl diphosphate synthase type I
MSLISRQADGTIFRPKSFTWTPTRWWRSAATRTSYPVEWHLEVPELNARLDFRPYSDKQEIRVFGSIRAIWEGAGIIQGRSWGRPVRGEARLEGHGYGQIHGARDYLSRWAHLVDEELARLLPRESNPDHLAEITRGAAVGYEPSAYMNTLSQPLWDLMDRDGKRWRGIFACLMLEAFGSDSSIYRSVLFAWPELLHNASLIIDDLQDGSLTRRGAETIHLRYGTDVAVGAANTAYFLSLFPVLNHPRLSEEQKLAMCSIYQRLMLCAHLGQSLDIFWTRNLTEDRLRDWMNDSMGDKIRQMYILKTAGPVEGLAEVAALIAGVKQRTRNSAMAFARAFGLAYQMIDDINNFSASPRWGKQRGEDLAGGKVTYLIFHALRLLPARDSNRLRAILCNPRMRAESDKRKEGIRLVMRSGACEKVRREARTIVETAWQEYSRQVQSSSAKLELRLLWENLLDLC